MFKRILSALLVAALVVGVSSVAANAVTGSFTTVISFIPQTRVAEYAVLDFDFENMLDLAFTISGLTFKLRAAMGIAGLEHVILAQEVTLGALTVLDEFVFAAAYGTAPPGPRYSDLLFVKKRVTAKISIGGITITNLAMFEDVRFDHPYVLRAPCAPDLAIAPYAGVCQKFAFGNILTISGETPSGIKVTFITGISASIQRTNTIKKATFPGSVVPQTLTIGIDEKLYFVEEKIIIRGIRIGPLTFGMDLTNEPIGDPPVILPHIWRAEITASAAVPPFTFSTVWITPNLLSFTGAMTFTVTIAGVATFEIFPVPAAITADISLPLDPVPAVLRLRLKATPAGLTMLRPTITMALGAGASVSIDAWWCVNLPVCDAGPPIPLRRVDTTLTFIPAGAFRVTAFARFVVIPPPGVAGLSHGSITLTILF